MKTHMIKLRKQVSKVYKLIINLYSHTICCIEHVTYHK
jgi:hypothetical protein